METIIIEDPALQTQAQPQGNAVLDQIESEALDMKPHGEEEQIPGAAPAPDSEKKPFVQPPGAFEQTHEMIVAGIKTVLKKYPGGEAAGAVWEQDLFKQVLIPVMVKYNISIHNLPCELVAIGVIIFIAKQSVDAMREAAAVIAKAQEE